MNQYADPWSHYTQDQAREIVVGHFDKVIHDLHCGCPRADRLRAWAALNRADWMITEAFQAWYDTFIGARTDG